MPEWQRIVSKDRGHYAGMALPFALLKIAARNLINTLIFYPL